MSAVAETAPLRVQLIAKTEFLAPPDVPWTTDADGGSALTEFSGRAWITGTANYLLDPSDPFPEGFTVGDLW